MSDDDDRAPDAPRRPRWGRRIAAVAILMGLVSPWWARPLLKRMDFFLVRHVEVRDARYTAPSEIRDRLGIDTTFSIWNDLEPLEKRVAEHPQLSGVRIARRFPATLVVRVEEHQPIALVPGASGMKAFDATGRALTLDPSRTPVDAPVVPRADTTVFRLLAQLRALNPDLFARVNEVRRAARDELVLDLVSFAVRIRPDIGVERLAQVSSVEDELAKLQRRAKELDFRFRDQVIARFP